MVRLIISNRAKEEAKRLAFDIEAAISKILQYVSGKDLTGLDHIFVTDLPARKWKHLANEAWASYFEKNRKSEAHIELYLKPILKHIQSPESLSHMLAVQYVGMAETIFHEIGHHVERTRSHGVKKSMREEYADSYSKQVLNNYVLENAGSVNACFDHLEQIADERGIPKDKISTMRAGWEKQYKAALHQSRRLNPSQGKRNGRGGGVTH